MTDFCTITPTRGDRPALLDFCLRQIERMNPAPAVSYVIEEKPKSEKDLTYRVRRGMEKAKAEGFDIAYILEDDDYYPANYFERMDIGSAHIVGCEKSIYYNLRNGTYDESVHTGRSSLFNTGFRISALKEFTWPADNYIFLDLELWRYAHTMRSKLLPASVGIGIKHGIGVTGGKGHNQNMKNKDPHLTWLKANVDEEAFRFYSKLRMTLC